MQCPLDHRRQTPPIRRLQGKILSIFDEFQPAYALLTPVAVGRKWTSTNGSKIFSALRGLPSSTLLYAPAAACLLGACFPLTASSRLSIFAGGSLGLALATRKGTKIVGLVLACSCFALLTARAPKPLKSLERGLGAARVRVLENRSAVQRDGSIAQRALVEVEAGRHLNMQRSIEPGTRLWVQDCDLPPQTVARVTLDVRPRAQPRNPDVMVHWPQRAHGSARLVGQPVVLERSALLERLFAMRAQLRTNLLRDLSQRSAAFVAALTLGDQALVGPTDYASVQAAGVAHILAVSGLHIGAASLVTLWLIRHTLLALVLLAPALARFNIRRATHIVAAPLALVHGLLAGGSPSALRASWIVAAAHVLVFLLSLIHI